MTEKCTVKEGVKGKMANLQRSAILIVAALTAGASGNLAEKSVQATHLGSGWYYTGTLTATISTSVHSTTDQCSTKAKAQIFENDRSDLVNAKDRSAVTIQFAETCVHTVVGGDTTTTYWFTTDAAHLNDGQTVVGVNPKTKLPAATPIRIQPYTAGLAPDLLGPGKASVHYAYLPLFFTKAVKIVTTQAGQVTKSVDSEPKSLTLDSPLIGAIAANKAGVILHFRGDQTFKSYYFENQKGTLHVTWNLGNQPFKR